MLTHKQIAARRANARKSRGPSTAAGKEKSSQNAVKFGIFSRNPIVGGESPEEFAAHRAEIVDSLAPAPGTETKYALEIADIFWRLKRFAPMEAGILNVHYCEDQISLSKTLERRERLENLVQQQTRR